MKRKQSLWVLGLLLAVMVGVVGIAEPAQAAAKWKYQSIWVPSITLWRPDKYFCDLMNNLAAPDLEIQYFAGGTLVTKSDEIFEAVQKGTLDAATDWPSYWAGKNTAFDLISSVPVWFNPGDYMVWVWQGGGFELAQELYGKFGIVYFPHALTGPESGQRSNKPITKGDDYKGVKMRQCGRNHAKILNDIGGAAIFMPGAEIYLALSRGTIDAAEFSVPEVDWSMGLHEVTKYWVLPGWHQPGPLWGVMVNKKSFDSLPDKVKFMFQQAAQATMMWSWTYFEWTSGEYTRKMMDKGIKVTRLDDATLDKLTELAYNYFIADAEANPDHAKIAYSQVRYLKNIDIWRTIQQPFMFGRTPPKLDELYGKIEAIAKKHNVYEPVIQLEKQVRARMDKQEFWKPGTPYAQNPVMPK